MYFVGLHLGRGEKRPTGIAVLDQSGQLLHVSTRGTDEEIAASVSPYLRDDCLVAIDAPLVVAEAQGRRPRGARLTAALGLDLDPASRAPRRAIEVSPQPATAELFGLGRTLTEHSKPARTVSQLRSELEESLRLLEGLALAEPPLLLCDSAKRPTLADLAIAATSKSELRRVQDQVAAVVCAYVGLFGERRPEGSSLHDALVAGEPDRDADRVRSAVRTYAEMHPQLQAATERYLDLVTTLLDDAGINYLSVTGRTKSPTSFATKARRTQAGRPVFSDPLTEISDQIGIRVITYLRSDVTAVADLLSDQFTVLDDRDMGEETASEGRFGYASRHLLIAPDPRRPAALASDFLGERRAQVQVRTVLQHAWAEFEHAIRYKGTVPAEHVTDLDRRFTLAAGLLELADREFSMISDRLQAPLPDKERAHDRNDPRIGAQDLATFLANKYADAGWSRPDHYEWVAGLLLELGITSLEELAELLAGVDSAAIDARMGYKYPAGAVRRLDDALLWLHGSRYVGLHGNAHRKPLLQARLEKLRTDEPEG